MQKLETSRACRKQSCCKFAQEPQRKVAIFLTPHSVQHDVASVVLDSVDRARGTDGDCCDVLYAPLILTEQTETQSVSYPATSRGPRNCRRRSRSRWADRRDSGRANEVAGRIGPRGSLRTGFDFLAPSRANSELTLPSLSSLT